MHSGTDEINCSLDMKNSMNRKVSTTLGSNQLNTENRVSVQELDELENTYARVILEIENSKKQMRARPEQGQPLAETMIGEPNKRLQHGLSSVAELEVKPLLNTDGLKIEQLLDGHQIKPNLSPIKTAKNVAVAEGTPIAITPPQHQYKAALQADWTNPNRFQDKKEAGEEAVATKQQTADPNQKPSPQLVPSPNPTAVRNQKKAEEKKHDQELRLASGAVKLKNTVKRKKSLAEKTKKMKTLKEGLEFADKRKKRKKKGLMLRWILEAEERKNQKKKKMQQICPKKTEEKTPPPPPPSQPLRIF